MAHQHIKVQRPNNNHNNNNNRFV